MNHHVRCRLTVPLLALGLSGCAIKTPHLPISQWPITQHAMYYREPLPYRVAMLPMKDARPARERTGQRPRGMFLLVWNKRVGDYYTSDAMYGNEVTGQLNAKLGEYLKSANVFADTVWVYPAEREADAYQAAEIQQLARDQVVDFLLASDLHHFYGSQTQKVSNFILPLYFINMTGWQDYKSLPWGKTAIRFVLYDGKHGDILWRQTLEASRTLPTDSDPMTKAALDAFTDVAGKLAASLRELRLTR